MQYLAWRVLSGLNRRIKISFLLVGHTKFAPDWCFGLLKQRFRKTSVGCLEDLVRVVNQSADTNTAELVGKEDGTTLVEQFDWAGFFQPYFRRGAFDGIKSWHHLVFSSEKPKHAVVKVYNNSEEKTLSLLSKEHPGWNPCPDNLPPVLPPPGLPAERRKYLFDKIREFVPEEHKDTVCPPPPAATSSPAAPLTEDTPTTPPPSPSPPLLHPHPLTDEGRGNNFCSIYLHTTLCSQ